MNERPSTVIVGVGNLDRQDDAAGLLVVQALQGRLSAEAMAVEAGDDILEALSSASGAERIIVVDAVRTGAEPGVVSRWPLDHLPASVAAIRTSSHGIAVSDALQLMRVLKDEPVAAELIGIEVASLKPGGTMSPAVAQAVRVVAELLLQEVAVCTNTGS